MWRVVAVIKGYLKAGSNRSERAAQIVRQGVRDGVELVHRVLDAIQHAVECGGELRHLVAATALGDALREVLVTNAGGGVVNLANRAEHAAGDPKDDAESQKNIEQPEKEKTDSKTM